MKAKQFEIMRVHQKLCPVIPESLGNILFAFWASIRVKTHFCCFFYFPFKQSIDDKPPQLQY